MPLCPHYADDEADEATDGGAGTGTPLGDQPRATLCGNPIKLNNKLIVSAVNH